MLWQVSLGVGAGEIVALVGANGAGKTTLLRALSGLREGFLKLTRGRVRFRGEDLEGLDPAQIVTRGIAHVPEGRHLFPGLTVLENLRLGGYLRARRREAREALEGVLDLLPPARSREASSSSSPSDGRSCSGRAC